MVTVWCAPQPTSDLRAGATARLLPSPGVINPPLMTLFGHTTYTDECPLLGAKRTWTNRCLPISIYEYTA